MKPIIVIAIAAIGLFTIVGSGSLLQDTIVVWLQAIGTGAEDTETPLDHISVDFRVDKETNFDAEGDAFYKNKVTACSLHIDSEDLVNPNEGIKKVICKVTDALDNAIAEGSITFANGGDIDCSPAGLALDPPTFCPSEQYLIDDLEESWLGALILSNVFDVRIVAIGQSQTG